MAVVILVVKVRGPSISNDFRFRINNLVGEQKRQRDNETTRHRAKGTGSVAGHGRSPIRSGHRARGTRAIGAVSTPVRFLHPDRSPPTLNPFLHWPTSDAATEPTYNHVTQDFQIQKSSKFTTTATTNEE